jgi:hypothetical protein
MIRFHRIFLPSSLLLALVVATTSMPADAQDIAACRKIADDKERLACFDRASQAPAPPPAAAASPAAPPVSTFNPFALFGRDTPPSTKPEDFGRSSLPVTAPKPPASATEPPAITSITARVTRVIDPDGKPKFVLDNGQIWGALNYININPRDNGKNTIVIETSLVGYLARLNDSSVQFNVRRLK